MKHKKEFFEAIDTLLYSWGGDTPSEAIWGLNNIVEWIEKEYNIKINNRFSEDPEDDKQKVIRELKKKL